MASHITTGYGLNIKEEGFAARSDQFFRAMHEAKRLPPVITIGHVRVTEAEAWNWVITGELPPEKVAPPPWVKSSADETVAIVEKFFSSIMVQSGGRAKRNAAKFVRYLRDLGFELVGRPLASLLIERKNFEDALLAITAVSNTSLPSRDRAEMRGIAHDTLKATDRFFQDIATPVPKWATDGPELISRECDHHGTCTYPNCTCMNVGGSRCPAGASLPRK